jgi:predicted GNAT family acetyltransferase
MQIVEYSDATAFLHRTNKFLFAREDINNMLISGALALAKATTARSPRVSFFAIENAGGVAGAAMRLADGRFLVSTMPADTATALGREIAARSLEITGLSGPKHEAAAACEAFAAAANKSWSTKFTMKMMRLHATPPPTPIEASPGLARQAKDKDRKLVLEWTLGFVKECGLDETERETEEMVHRYLEGRQLFIWEDSSPVAMAGFSGHTPSGVRVNMVYTDRKHRGKGYAASVVQFVSRKLLQADKKFCFLFADAKNPTSIAVYERLGYETVGEWSELRFKS